MLAVAVSAMAAMPVSAVADDEEDGAGRAGPPSVTVVSSLPLNGFQSQFTVPMQNAIRMAIADAGGKVRGVRIKYVSLDDGSPSGGWPQEVANANAAAADPSVVAFIGPFNSTAAMRSIPILCEAGLGMISPSNTYPGLTKSLPTNRSPGEPGIFYPNGCERNYSRDIPTDAVGGAVAAARSRVLGFNKVYAVTTSSPDPYAYGFVTEAGVLGLQVLGSELIPGNQTSYLDLGRRVLASGSELLYLSCYDGPDRCGQIVVDIRAAAPAVRILLTDNTGFGPAFLSYVGPAGEGLLDVRESFMPADFTGATAVWYSRYQSQFGPIPFDKFDGAVYAYEATNVVLAAISASRSHLTRAAVRQALMSTTNYQGLLGKWSLDAYGDTTSSLLSTAEVVNGHWVSTGTASLP